LKEAKAEKLVLEKKIKDLEKLHKTQGKTLEKMAHEDDF